MKKDSTLLVILVFVSVMLVPFFASAQEEPNDLATLVDGNTTFASDLYQRLSSSEGNLFFSPYSISTVLAMAYAGARGETKKEMAEVLHFSLPQNRLHPSFASLLAKLAAIQKAGDISLSAANSLWPQRDYHLENDYLSLIKTNYGVSITPVDYLRAAEQARAKINLWVEENTQQKIKDLIQPGVLQPSTRLVLVNAIYFKGSWRFQFKADKTKEAPFYLTEQTQVQVPLMTQTVTSAYAQLDSFQILELPYTGGGLSMLIMLPREKGGVKQLEAMFSAENLNLWKTKLRQSSVVVYLPKLKMTSMFQLTEMLRSMGIQTAFGDADFSGMTGSEELQISDVLHKAFVEINEEGTEAAAATAVAMRLKSSAAKEASIPVFRADRPFLFLIQEKETGSILFLGRVVNPTES